VYLNGDLSFCIKKDDKIVWMFAKIRAAGAPGKKQIEVRECLEDS
jgi:hypothetical protein